MLHASSSTGTEIWQADPGRVPVGDSRQILSSYLNEWRQLAIEFGGEAHLLDELFVGGSGEGIPKGVVIPRSTEYFRRFYDARASFGTYVKALCKIRTAAGTCASEGSSGTLEPMGLWPRPERQNLLDALMALEGYLSLGTALPSALLPPQTSARMRVGAAVVAILGLATLTAGVIRAARR